MVVGRCRPDPYHLPTLPNPSSPRLCQLRGAPTTVDHRCHCTICDINLSRSAGFGGRKAPGVSFNPGKAGGQRTTRMTSIHYSCHEKAWRIRWLDYHSVLLESGSMLQWPVGSSLCSNKVSWVLLVMITDVTGSGGSGSPCAKKKKGEVGELSSEDACERWEIIKKISFFFSKCKKKKGNSHWLF